MRKFSTFLWFSPHKLIRFFWSLRFPIEHTYFKKYYVYRISVYLGTFYIPTSWSQHDAPQKIVQSTVGRIENPSFMKTPCFCPRQSLKREHRFEQYRAGGGGGGRGSVERGGEGVGERRRRLKGRQVWVISGPLITRARGGGAARGGLFGRHVYGALEILNEARGEEPPRRAETAPAFPHPARIIWPFVKKSGTAKTQKLSPRRRQRWRQTSPCQGKTPYEYSSVARYPLRKY